MSRISGALAGAAVLTMLLANPAPAQDPPGVAKVGFVFSNKQASVKDAPSAGAKEVAKVPSGLRLVYRRVVESGGQATWYRVEPPGGVAGWLAAADSADKRPTTLPPPKPITVESSGVAMAKTAGAQTAAARGLSTAAVEYAADRESLKKAADHFITLEHTVEKHFDDPHDAEGNYPDIDVPKRAERANAFKAGIK